MRDQHGADRAAIGEGLRPRLPRPVRPARIPPPPHPLHHDGSARCSYRLVMAASPRGCSLEGRRPGGTRLALRWGLALGGVGPWRLQTAQSSVPREGTLRATVCTPTPNPMQAAPRPAMGNPGPPGWGLSSLGIQQVLEVGEAGGWGWGRCASRPPLSWPWLPLAFTRVTPQPGGGFVEYVSSISFWEGLPGLTLFHDPWDCCLLNCLHFINWPG